MDIKQVDAGFDETDIEFRVETYTSTSYDERGYLWLDTDQDPSTGWTESELPGYGLNDIGADYFVWMDVSFGYGDVYDYYFNYMGSVSITSGTYDFYFTIPLSYLGNDDGIMDVTIVLGDYYAPTDIAPDTGHGTTGLSIEWLSVSPTSGALYIDSQMNITLTINATELEVGTYNASIIITSNDPDESTVTIPVHLTVASAPHDIVVTNVVSPSPTEVMKSTYVNATIENLGLNDETNISINLLINGVIENSSIISFIGNGNTTYVNFSWTPTTIGNYTVGIYAVPFDSENITTNNLMEVEIIAEGYPDIWIEPTGFNITVTRGELLNETLV
ncbi:hypothetical protein FP804_04400, partial [archaeon]|nr:hypothetical protein [archaeon]